MAQTKRKKKTKNYYFTQETEDAIILYNELEKQGIKVTERNKLFNEEIYPAFLKLTENIIHTYKFRDTDVEDLADLQHEIIVFLHKKMWRFDPSSGFKAFSYFQTIVKRWLIAYVREVRRRRHSSIDIFNYNGEGDELPLESDDLMQIEDLVSNSNKDDFIISFYDFLEVHMHDFLFESYELKVADALVNIYKNIDAVDNIENKKINKKLIYHLIKEQTLLDTNKITKTIKKLNELYTEQLDNFYRSDDFSFKTYL